ncbi:component of the polarisome [Dinochytrium kinnereticum]|nr:component of the polarisome [Dinochytrium kinnereticum]
MAIGTSSANAQAPITVGNTSRTDKKKRTKDAFGVKNMMGAVPTQQSSAPAMGTPPPPPSDTLNPYVKQEFHKRSDSPSGRMQNGGSSYLHPGHNHSHRPISPAPTDRSPAAFHFQSLDRMSPPHSRSASPAPSVSSTLAAERLARLTDAQVADLAAQVSAESFRRRTPVGALIASYELSGPTGGATGLSAASRLSMMSNDQFRILANDLEAEASRRDIPGIDTLGRSRTGSIAMVRTASGSLSESMLTRDVTLLRAKFGPNNPAAAEAMEAAVLANSNGSMSTSLSPSTGASPSPIASAVLSSSPTNQSFLTNGIPQTVTATANLDRSMSSASISNLPTRLIPVGAGPAAASTIASASLPRSLSATNISSLSNPSSNANLNAPMSAPPLAGMASANGSAHPDLLMVEEDPDRMIWRSRLGSLADGQFSALRRDTKAEMDRRKALRRGILVPVSPVESGDEVEGEVNGSRKGPADNDSGFAASVIAAVNERTNAALTSTPPSSRPNSDEQQQFGTLSKSALTPANRNDIGTLTKSTSHSTLVSMAGVSPSHPRLEELMRSIPSQDLWQLWEDSESEVARRAAGGLVVAGTSAAEFAAAAEVERAVAASAAIGKEKEKEKKREMRRAAAAEKEGKEAREAREAREAANVAAWRSRISKLTDEQMAEVTADVYDEMTRRRDKSAPFLPPRSDLSPKRNEARKELSKLPSRELKMLWSIIHESMKKRKMVS